LEFVLIFSLFLCTFEKNSTRFPLNVILQDHLLHEKEKLVKTKHLKNEEKLVKLLTYKKISRKKKKTLVSSTIILCLPLKTSETKK